MAGLPCVWCFSLLFSTVVKLVLFMPSSVGFTFLAEFACCSSLGMSSCALG